VLQQYVRSPIDTSPDDDEIAARINRSVPLSKTGKRYRPSQLSDDEQVKAHRQTTTSSLCVLVTLPL
jgi:hypothetical protein